MYCLRKILIKSLWQFKNSFKRSVMKKLFTLILIIASLHTIGQVVETEPNGTFESANFIDQGIVRTGSVDNRISNGVTIDQYDYFMAVLPTDGTLNIIVNGTNTSSTNGYLYMYGYDRRKANGLVLARYVGNTSNVNAGATINDIIKIYGRASDTFYFRLETSSVFSYSLSYTMSDVSTNDVEPNNTFEESLPIAQLQEKVGHIGYVSAGAIDANDYYRAILPQDGSLKIFVSGTNRSGANGYMYLYAYDRRKGNGQILAKYIANSSNIQNDSTIYDTIQLYGRAADTVYFRMTSSGAFQYGLKYEVSDLTPNDPEPNNDFDESLTVNHTESKQGHIGYVLNGTADGSDFYRTVLPFDGTLKIYVKGTNYSGGSGYLYMYGYDRRKGNGQVLAKYIGNTSNVAHISTVFDTIYLYGRAADTFYFRMTSSGAFSYTFRYEISDSSENDTEPNNTFEEPILTNQLDVKKGHISYVKNGSADANDFYKTVVPIDGTLKIFIQGRNRSGGSGYLYLYGYDRRKANGQVFATYISGNSNIKHDSTIYDTITIYGVLADTFYFRVISAGAFSYQISYNTIVNSQFDPEPNNTFEESIPVRQGILQNGQIGYTLGGNRDNFDYYVTNLPTDGTMKLIIQGTNNSGSSGYLYIYGFDRRKGNGQVMAKYIGNTSNVAAGASVYDTIYLYGRASDTFYYRIESSQPFSYNFSYDIIDTSENDVEPNSTFEQSLPITFLEDKIGHIGYVKSGTSDADDYYRTIMPQDGTIKLLVNGTNRTGASGYLYIYAYDRRKGNGQILAKYIGNTSNVSHNGSVYDTIYLFGRAADTIYFRITSSGAFSYNLKYDLEDTSTNDIEPNNSFDQSIPIGIMEEKKGHISYVMAGGNDADDFYRTVLPADGTLKIIVQGRNRSGTNGYLYMYAYDRRKGGGQILAKYIANSSNIKADSTIYDTIYLYGRAADTAYFRMISSGAFSYALKYDLKDSSDNDVEPNNLFTEAIPIIPAVQKKGHISYVKNGLNDSDDYYVTKLPTDGTLRIIVQGTNKSGANGYLYMYAYDRRKGGGQILAKYIANSSNIKSDSTIYDTILLHCRAVDTTYFRIISSGAFTYSIAYNMMDTSANDLEPNNTFETAIPIAINELKPGHIGYAQNGVDDASDYYMAVVPSKGNLRIVTEVTNTSGGGGYVYVYGYDRRKGAGQVLARYIANNGNIPPNATITDTFTINCSTLDTFYYRVTSAGCFRYSVRLLFQSLQPKADFTTTRVGNTFGFQMNPTSNGTSYLWDLGNGITTTNTVPPLVTYGPGFYTAKLIARNNANSCLFTDTAKTSFTVEGIERYTPHIGGPGNIFFTVYGGGLDTNVIFKLTQGSRVYIDSATRVNQNGNIYTCVVDLHDAPLGFYNVEIRNGTTVYNYPNGFKVEALVEKLGVDLVGNERIRTNINNVYVIRVHNEGNTHTGVSKVFLLTAPNIIVTELDSSMPISSNQYVNMDTIPHVIPVTTAQDFPINGNLRGFAIEGIPAGGYKDLKFIFNFQVGVSDVYVWSAGPINGSPDRPWLSDCWKSRLKWAYQVGNYGLDLVPVVDCGWNLAKTVFSGLNFFGNAVLGAFSSGYDVAGAYASMGKTGLKAIKNCAGEAGLVTTGPAGLAIEAADMGSDILLNGIAVNTATQEWIDKCNPEPKDKQKKKTDARTSWDPNAKNGPPGIGNNRYINGKDKLMTYAIFFENLPAATLPAQNVMIYDTLDKNVYDLSTLNVESFSIGTNFYNFSQDQNQFVAQVNLTAALDVRVNVKLDTATGVLTSTFITLDRSTGDTTTNQLAGFLPPNVVAPNGQGVVTYSLYMKNGLPDGTQLKNKAKIIFDTNEPINTEEWKNTLDIVSPVSSVSSVTAITDTSATMVIGGTDATSGIEYYMLYSSLNGGPYQKAGHVRSPLTFFGQRGATYNFYAIAVDSVGNIESKTPRIERTITFPGVFAIVLGNITATNVGERHRIDWSTLTEDMGDKFEMEKSPNGRDFTSFASIEAKGFASAYTIYDARPAEGRTYYRLKTIDKGGASKFSKVVSAYLVKNGAFVLEAYPNPVHNLLTISISGPIEGNASISLINMMGTIVRQYEVVNNQLDIDMSQFASGLYSIRYTDKRNTKVIKLTKH